MPRFGVALVCVLASLSHAAAAPGANYAFLVGCSGYNNVNLPKLPYTLNDVKEFKKVLVQTGFPEDNIKLLVDEAGQPARYLSEKAKIVKELKMICDATTKDDTLLVAVSGHGVHFKGDKFGYFCPTDADLEDKKTLIPMDGGPDSLFEILKASKAQTKLLLVNACRNPVEINKAQAAQKINLDDADEESVPKGIAALYSCKTGQKSYFDPDRQRGVFFEHVINAWKGDYHVGDGPLTVEMFFDQVRHKTRVDVDKLHGQSQVPEVRAEYTGAWVLRKAENFALISLGKARLALKEGRADDALRLINSTLERDEKCAEAYVERGNLYLARKEYDKAAADGGKAVDLEPKSPAGLLLRGTVQFERAMAMPEGKYESPEYQARLEVFKKAHADADAVCKMKEPGATAYLLRGKSLYYAELRMGSSYFQDYEKAIQLDPALADAHYYMAKAHGPHGVFEKAFAAASKAIELDPNRAEYYEVRASLVSPIYAKKEKAEPAIRDFTKALSLDPKRVACYLGRAELYLVSTVQNFPLAAADMREAIKLNPKEWMSYSRLAYAYSEQKKFAEAIQACTDGLDVANDWGKSDLYHTRSGLHGDAFAHWLDTTEDIPTGELDRRSLEADRRALADIDRSIELLPKQYDYYANVKFKHVARAQIYGSLFRATKDQAYKKKQDDERALVKEIEGKIARGEKLPPG